MSIDVMTWVWNNSKSKNTPRLVLLAIADCARSDGGHAFPSIPELKRKANASERAIQDAIKSLQDLGELLVEYNKGPKGTNLYQVVMPPQNLHPAESAPPQNPRGDDGPKSAKVKPRTPAESAPPPQNLHPADFSRPPAESAPGTVIGTVSTTSGSAQARPPARPPRPRGTRIPDDFRVTPEMRAWFDANIGEHVDGKRETEKFRNYWAAKTGQAATKLDWPATWRNWMLKASEYR